MIWQVLLGIALGVPFVVLLQRIGGRLWTYVMPLALLPTVYVVFALVDGDGAAAGKELLAGIPWIAASVVLLAFRIPYAALIVGTFWLLHGVYDVVHDDHLFTNSGVPDWYPLLCCGVDVVVGGYLILSGGGRPQRRPGAVAV